MHDGVPFGVTLKMAGPLIVRSGRQGILGRGNNGDKGPEKRSMLCTGKRLAEAKYALKMRDLKSRQILEGRPGGDKTEDRLQVGGHVGM